MNQYGILSIEDIREEIEGTADFNNNGEDIIDYDFYTHKDVVIVMENGAVNLNNISGISLHMEDMKIKFYRDEIPNKDNGMLVLSISVLFFKLFKIVNTKTTMSNK